MAAMGIFDKIKGGKQDDQKKAELKENIRKIREKVQEQDQQGGAPPAPREGGPRGPAPAADRGPQEQGGPSEAPEPPRQWSDLQEEWEGEETRGEGERFGEPEQAPAAPRPGRGGEQARPPQDEPERQSPAGVEQPAPREGREAGPQPPEQDSRRQQEQRGRPQAGRRQRAAQTGAPQKPEPRQAAPKQQPQEQPSMQQRTEPRRQEGMQQSPATQEPVDEHAGGVQQQVAEPKQPTETTPEDVPEPEDSGEAAEAVEETELPEPPELEDIEIPDIEHEGPLFITVDKFQRALNMIGDMKRMTDDIEGQARSLQETLDDDSATQEDMQNVMDQFAKRTESMKDLIMP